MQTIACKICIYVKRVLSRAFFIRVVNDKNILLKSGSRPQGRHHYRRTCEVMLARIRRTLSAPPKPPRRRPKSSQILGHEDKTLLPRCPRMESLPGGKGRFAPQRGGLRPTLTPLGCPKPEDSRCRGAPSYRPWGQKLAKFKSVLW